MVLYFPTKGLLPGSFAKHLAGDRSTSMGDLKRRAQEWIRIEEWEKTHHDPNQVKKNDKGKAPQ
jgi:hypothetical protein